MNRILNIFSLFFILILSFSSCGEVDESQSNQVIQDESKTQDKKLVGYIYTTTNGEGENEVVQLTRYSDGTVGDEKIYPTKGKGGSNHAAPAHGDYDAQGNLKIIDNYLLTTNPGDNTISVFNLDRTNGNLTFNSIIGSEGGRPVTLDYYAVDASQKEYWVVVGNQWGTPTVIYEGDKIERYPSKEWLEEDLSQAHESDKDRSVELFKLDMATGKLIFVKTLVEYVRQNGGPADVKFSPDGKKLAVSLWGIPHFFAENPLLEEMVASRMYTYDFDSGEISNPRYFEEEGLSGATGFHWNNNSENLYLTYFNVINDKADNGLVVMKDSLGNIEKQSNHATAGGDKIDEACWTAISEDQTRLYVCSYLSNEITSYSLDNTGAVLKTLGVERRKDYQPNEDSKDIWISPDNKYLYVLGSFFSYSVNTMKIADNGVEYLHQYTLNQTKDQVGNPGVYDLVGFDGFDIE